MCIAQRPTSNLNSFQAKDLQVKHAASSHGCHKPTLLTSSSSSLSSSSASAYVDHDAYTAKSKHPRLIVHHHYTDYAHIRAPAVDHYAALARSGANTAFPLKLYDMLERVERDGYAHIISWQPHGRCFVVHRPDDFRDLLPKYFKLSKVASFQRQLNLYGFTRISSGADRNGYYHERFLRGKPFLIEYMARAKVKGTCVRARANPTEEPDFWKMPWVVVTGDDPATAAAPYKSVTPDQPPKPVRSVPASAPLPVPPKPSAAGSSSVVSRDESTHSGDDSEQQEDETDLYEPIPVAATSLPSSSLSEQQQSPAQENDDFNDDDVVMTGWGMPFHYLGSLPEDITPPAVVSSSSSCVPTGALINDNPFEPTPIGSMCLMSMTNTIPAMLQALDDCSNNNRTSKIGNNEETIQYDDFAKVMDDLLVHEKIGLDQLR